MKRTNKTVENFFVLTTAERFELTHSEVKKELLNLKNKGLVDSALFEKIKNEDLLLKIKLRTYKKNRRQIVVGFVLLVIGFTLMNHSSLRYLIIIAGIITVISSLFGILSNKITKKQKNYIK